MNWKSVEGYEGLYRICDLGLVVNEKTNRVLYGNISTYGYRVASLTKGGKKKDHKLHRLLALAFIPNPNNYPCVNHLNGNKLDNRLENLEWCTYARNSQHAKSVLGVNTDERAVVQYTMEGKPLAIWRSMSQAAKSVKGSYMVISSCCKHDAESGYGYRWEYFTGDFSGVVS